jgi:hypothetical protein
MATMAPLPLQRIDSFPAPQDEPPNEHEVLRDWVMETFDRAIRQCMGGNLQLLRTATGIRAEAALRRAGGDPLWSDAQWRSQSERLIQLAPAAIEWVDRHAAHSSVHSWAQFRRHLLQRCDDIICHVPLPVDEE